MLTSGQTRHFFILVCLSLWAAVAASQEQGQYRSKIQLDPLGEMGKGSEMSAAELEQQINSIDDPYAKSSAGRFLARHHVQQKNYPAAIEYYQQALAVSGLSAVANREMLRELAQVYLLDENYAEAATALERALAIDLVPDARDFLLLAQTRYRQGNYVEVVVALDGIAANGLQLESPQLRQALALYYRTGAFEQCEDVLAMLLKEEPGNPEYWHQLASVYLQQNKRKQALDHLVLAREKNVPFSSPELLLLVDLQALNGNPFGAAQILEQGLAAGDVPADAANQRKLFELWLQARERDRAVAALEKAARGSGDTELYLYLAQLQMEDEQWPRMQDTLVQACAAQLDDRFVSRANLLLGISLLKQHRESDARRAFINATLVGGANAEAAEWLQYMQAAPATEGELRRVRGPCYGSEGKQEPLSKDPSVAISPVQQAAEPVQAEPWLDIEIKTVPASRFFTSPEGEDLQSIISRVRDLAPRLNVSLVKAGGSANGPLHIIGSPGEELQIGFPLRGTAQPRGRYRIYSAGPFNCAAITLTEKMDEPADLLGQFSADVAELGYSWTGEFRIVLQPGASLSYEIQLGIE